MFAFLLLLGFFTNFNCVTLKNKINIALTAELQFNQNDIKNLDRVQKYLGEIKKNIIRKNLRKHNMDQRNNIKYNEQNGNIKLTSYNNQNVENYVNNRNKHNIIKDSNSEENKDRMRMVDIAINIGTNSKKDIKNKEKIIKNVSKKNNSTKTTVGMQEFENIHLHEIHNKLIIMNTTPTIIRNTTEYKTKNSTKHAAKPRELTLKLTKNNSKNMNSTKTTVGQQQTNYSLHIHDIQNKLIIIHTSQITKNTTMDTKTVSVLPNKRRNKLKTTKSPSARRHRHTNIITLKNNEYINNGKEKSRNKVQNLTTMFAKKYYHGTKKEKHENIEEMDNSSKQTKENYINLDDYLKSKDKEENDGKNKEVLEKIKYDLGNLFSNDKVSHIGSTKPTSDKPDSFQELEKAFGFDL